MLALRILSIPAAMTIFSLLYTASIKAPHVAAMIGASAGAIMFAARLSRFLFSEEFKNSRLQASIAQIKTSDTDDVLN
ncbi:hypothetical protein ABID21_002215 [Pseudorhizobium tarimense]|uniref:Uncharacterized protein n=1 Tax=Pseudorhizobium tarimense TaxID=1079109 RepID=A0ABV2H6D3_9HYPH|nr:hypothetical protein [Pseudorhizobium tarimense]MCJ8519077.1 hypothetical protein [Pseudorhizobium tarimense]